MKNNYPRILFGLALFTGLLLLMNTLYYRFFNQGADDTFTYSLVVMYAFFFILSSIILTVLIYIGKKNKEQLGYAFLLLTGVKMGISYILARAIISKGEIAATEKVNFFAIFIMFLVIEAYYTARLLNNKQ